MDLDLAFKKLIMKQANYQSGNLGLNLLISRLQSRYASKPTQEELENSLQEMRAYFAKYDSILQKDIEMLKKL